MSRKRVEPARRAARAVIRQFNALQQETAREMHSWSAGDWFGPSLSDHHDADALFEDKITAVINKAIKSKAGASQ